MAFDQGTSFLETLRADLQSKGVHEQELAEWLSTSVSTVSRRLNGKSEFRCDELIAMASTTTIAVCIISDAHWS